MKPLQNSPRPFNRFWFEGQLWFKWVETEKDLEELISIHREYKINPLKAHQKNGALGKALPAFGFYPEYTGEKTLEQYLKDQGYEKGNDTIPDL